MTNFKFKHKVETSSIIIVIFFSTVLVLSLLGLIYFWRDVYHFITSLGSAIISGFIAFIYFRDEINLRYIEFTDDDIHVTPLIGKQRTYKFSSDINHVSVKSENIICIDMKPGLGKVLILKFPAVTGETVKEFLAKTNLNPF